MADGRGDAQGLASGEPAQSAAGGSSALNANPQGLASGEPAPSIAPIKFSDQRLIKVPMTRQATDYTCGAAVLQSVIGYYGENVREGQLAKELRSNSKLGTNYQRMVTYAKQHGYAVEVKTDTTIEALKAMLDKGAPVIVLLQAWPERTVDYASDWDDGHYVVAIGYDEKNLYFMDPCTLGNYAYVPTAEFLTRWHDRTTGEKLVHFTMQVTKPTPGFDPMMIQKME